MDEAAEASPLCRGLLAEPVFLTQRLSYDKRSAYQYGVLGWSWVWMRFDFRIGVQRSWRPF